MKKILKITGILAAVLVLIAISLAVFVRLYLTDERLRAMLVPRAEQALGRPVTLESIQVNLLRGIILENFAIQEEDGSEFFRAQQFVLDYELLPLLDRKLIISKAALEEPFLRIERRTDGKFNFESLAFLSQPETAAAPQTAEGPSALPLALTIDQIAVNKARVVFNDQLGELPAADSTANINISLATGADPGSLIYHGRYDFSASVTHGGVKPQLSGKGEFNPEAINYEVDATLEEEKAHFAGAVQNWRAVPAVRLDVSSERLNLDRLLALAAALPEVEKKPAEETPPSTLTAQGRISVGQAVYQNLSLRDFVADYTYARSILEIKDLSAGTAGGKIVGQSRVDLAGAEPAYAGNLKMISLQAGELAAFISPRYGDWLTGSLSSALEFSGRGTEWQTAKKQLALKGEYAVKDGRFKEIPLTAVVAELLGLPELRSFSFTELTGNLLLEKGNILLDSIFSGQNIRAQATGTVGLDGQLNVPLSFQFSGPLAQKIQSRTSLARYLTDKEGVTTVNLKLTGMATSPRPTLDVGAAGGKLKEQVEKKVYQELDRFLQRRPQEQTQEPPAEQPAQPPVQDLFKGLFGK